MDENQSENSNCAYGIIIGLVGFVVACVVNKMISESGKYAFESTVACFGLVPCGIATAIGANKNRTLFGFLLGFLFSWLGVIVVSCFKPRKA